MALPRLSLAGAIQEPPDHDELRELCETLLKEWTESLLKRQLSSEDKGLDGGIICPACARIHGRCGDAVWPLMYRAEKTGDGRYLDASLRLMHWMDNVSTSDGAWINDVAVSDWKGITVFGAIALAEAVKHHGHLLDTATQTRWLQRLRLAGDYVYRNFKIGYGNVNYPVTATYGLLLLGDVLDEPTFTARSHELAQAVKSVFTPANHFLYGEGKPYNLKSPKGCLPVDLGYNVEESLQSLALYALAADHQDILEIAIQSLATHLEFMLPDGAWDNSWGTRNFKWTYWGSRTSDGCQPAYYVLADRHPAFYEAALRNTQLLKACTVHGLLHGGPHLASAGQSPCIHHTFAHAKALTTVLSQRQPAKRRRSRLPREQEYGVKAFPDVQTWLIAKGDWRGTVTGYDCEYTFKGGHATGGALSLLWHKKAGAVLGSSMTRFKMAEAANMQMNPEPSMPLTPRFELIEGGQTYSNISDLTARVVHATQNKEEHFTVHGRLVTPEGQDPSAGPCRLEVRYVFAPDRVTILARCESGNPHSRDIAFVLPVISRHSESAKQPDRNTLQVLREDCRIRVHAHQAITLGCAVTDRVFNHVPGFEALPVILKDPFASNPFQLDISVE